MRNSEKIDAQLGIIKTLQITIDNLQENNNNRFDSIQNSIEAIEKEILNIQKQLDTANIKLQSLIDFFNKADL